VLAIPPLCNGRPLSIGLVDVWDCSRPLGQPAALSYPNSVRYPATKPETSLVGAIQSVRALVQVASASVTDAAQHSQRPCALRTSPVEPRPPPAQLGRSNHKLFRSPVALCRHACGACGTPEPGSVDYWPVADTPVRLAFYVLAQSSCR